MITIRIASPNDVKLIQEIAYQTWPDVYGEILSVSQLDYMLKAFILKRLDNMVHNGHHFILAFEGAICLGFASYQHDYLDDQVTRLHKIYLLPEAQGKGAGRLLIDALVMQKRIT
jgi:GNAT superfamily N-acetyltransferase